MRGSNVAGINPVKLGGAGRGTSVANTGLKKVPGTKKATVAPNQKLNTKSRSGNYEGTVQGIRSSIHKNRGGKTMNKLFGRGN